MQLSYCREKLARNILYSLKFSSRVMVDTITRGVFIYLCWKVASEVLYQISLTNRGWYTWETDRGASTYAIGASNDHKAIDDFVLQKIILQTADMGC